MSSDYEQDINYDSSQPTELLAFAFPRDVTSAGNRRLPAGSVINLSPLDAVIQSGTAADLFTDSAAAANPSLTQTFEYVSDVTKWLYAVSGVVIMEAFPGVGVTLDVSIRILVESIFGSEPVETLIDQTYTDVGIAAQSDWKVPLKLFTFKLIKQHSRIRFTFTISATRTAGANTSTMRWYRVAFIVGGGRDIASLILQMKPAMNSSDQIIAAERTS